MFASYLRAQYTTVFPYTIRNESFEPRTNWHTWRKSLRSFATTMWSVIPAIIDDNIFQNVRFRNRFACCSNFEATTKIPRQTFSCDFRDSCSISRNWTSLPSRKSLIWCWDKQSDIISKRDRWSKDAQRNVKENWCYVRARGKRERARMREASKLKWAVFDGKFKLLSPRID